MCNITFIATRHMDLGKCTSEELLKIIEHINPDVILEELPQHGFTEIYERNREGSLETKAIKLFLRHHPIDHFPVDMDGNQYINKTLKNQVEGMFEHFKRSREYMNMRDQINSLSERDGFSFLNSDQCQYFMDQRHQIERFVLKAINNEKINEVYEFWLRLNDQRDSVMIKNIYHHCSSNKYKNALFLAGAEHRKPVMQIFPLFERDTNQKLNWNFNYFD